MYFFVGFFFLLFLPFSVFAKNVTVGSFSDHQHSRPMIVIHENNDWSFVNNIIGVPSSQNPLYALQVDCHDKNCIVVGGGVGSNNTLPYILHSEDNGTTWNFPLSIKGLPSGAFEFEMGLISCQNGNCVAGGSYHQYATCNYPIFLTSQDSFTQWKVESIANLPNIGNDCVYPTAMKCEGSFCVAVGKHIKASSFMSSDPLLFLSQSSGKNWQYLNKSNIRNLPSTLKNADTNGVDCIDKTCIVVGAFRDKNESSHPLVLRSEDEGRTWNFLKNLPTFPAAQKIELHHIACRGEFCVASGMAESGTVRELLLMTSQNKGSSWTFVDHISQWPEGAKLKDLSSLVCFAKGCILTGSLYDDSPNAEPYQSLPFFLIHRVEDQAWIFTQNISGVSLYDSHPSLFATNCMDDVCYSVGAYDSNYSYYPLILETRDAGLSWGVNKNVNNLPADFVSGVLYDI